MGVISGPLDKNYVVQKSIPVLKALEEIRFSVGEIKLMDTYLSRINSHNDVDDEVEFTTQEYMEIMGLNSRHPEIIEKATDGLLHKVVKISASSISADSGVEFKDAIIKKGFYRIVLFSKAGIGLNNDGISVITMRCSRDAKELFFNPDRVGYIHYALGFMIKLSHTNSVYLYTYLLTRQNLGTWTVDIDELRNQWLKLEKKKSYQDYRYFKRDVLDPSVREINKCTDINCHYKAIKRYQKVVTIQFTINFKSREEVDKILGEEIKNIPKELQAASQEPENTSEQNTTNIQAEETISTEDLSVSSSLTLQEMMNQYGEIRLPYVDISLSPEAMVSEICVFDDFDATEISVIVKSLDNKEAKFDNNESLDKQDRLRACYEKLLKERLKGTVISNPASYLAKIIETSRDLNDEEVNGDGIAFSPDFEKFWEIYPRKFGKVSTWKQWNLLLHGRRATSDELIEIAKYYAEMTHKDKLKNGGTYICYPSNFLTVRRKTCFLTIKELMNEDKAEEAKETQKQAKRDAELFELLKNTSQEKMSDMDRITLTTTPEEDDRKIEIALCKQMKINPPNYNTLEKPKDEKEKAEQAQIYANLETCWKCWVGKRSNHYTWTEEEDKTEKKKMMWALKDYNLEKVMRVIYNTIIYDGKEIAWRLINLLGDSENAPEGYFDDVLNDSYNDGQASFF